MAEYHGDIRLGETIDIKFCTVGTTGAPTQLAGTPVISAYVGNGTTQITAGITLTVDFDGVTGLNNVRVVATSGNGFATATNVELVITTGTVGGTSVVGYCVGSFSIENRSAVMPTTAARTLDVSAAGNAGIDWSNIEAPTTAQNLSGTNIDTDQVVASVTGAVGSVTGAVGSVTGNVGGNVTGSVGSVAAGGIASTSFAAGAIDAAAIAANAIGASELAADAIAEIADAVWDEDATGHQTGGTFGQAIGDPGADTTTIYQSVVTDAAGANIAADIIAIEAQTDDIGVAGAGLTAVPWNAAWDAEVQSEVNDGLVAFFTSAAAFVDLVWDELVADHAGVGSTGAALAAAGSAGDPWSTALPGAYGAGTAGFIIGTNINATISSRASQASVDTIDDFLDTEIAAIKAKTDSLTFTVAGQADVNVQYVNDVQVQGTGAPGDEWRPV